VDAPQVRRNDWNERWGHTTIEYPSGRPLELIDKMRITSKQRDVIREIVIELAGKEAEIILFGSRTDDQQRGGDLDLLVELPHPVDNPAWLMARLSAKISRTMAGRKTDVLLGAPNLMRFPIHDHARESGVRI